MRDMLHVTRRTGGRYARVLVRGSESVSWQQHAPTGARIAEAKLKRRAVTLWVGLQRPDIVEGFRETTMRSQRLNMLQADMGARFFREVLASFSD